MKNICVLTALLLIFVPNCFAAGSATGNLDFTKTGMTVEGGATATGTTSVAIGKTSTGVTVAWNTATGGYAIATQHKSGTKAYGTSYDSTSIFQTVADVEPGNVAFTSGALGATDTSDFTVAKGWKAM